MMLGPAFLSTNLHFWHPRMGRISVVGRRSNSQLARLAVIGSRPSDLHAGRHGGHMGAVRKLKPVIEQAQLSLRSRLRCLGITDLGARAVWRNRLTPELANTALQIVQHHGLPDLLGRVLAARGVTVDQVPVFLDPSLKALMPDPSTLMGMDDACRRLADAVQKSERVAIFGDYDVDGACSSALLARYLAQHGIKTRIYIPDRMAEGYGPNVKAMQTLVSEGANLIVTVDCGTTSFEALAALRKLKTDAVVLDHHQADETLPDVYAVVNPNRQDDISGQGHLCAAGVVFMTLVGGDARTAPPRTL